MNFKEPITIHGINSEKGVKQMQSVISLMKKFKEVDVMKERHDLKFYDKYTGITWVNNPCNSDIWDLWLVKKGTLGRQSRTFKRITLERLTDEG